MSDLFTDGADLMLDAVMQDGDLLRLLDETYSYVTGGSYADQPITWDAAASGQKRAATDVVFSGLPAVTVTYYEIWDAGLTAARWGGFVWEANETADSTTDRIVGNSDSHVDGDLIIFGGSTPGGLSGGTVYYVVNSTPDDFQVSETLGGTAVDITSDGPVLYGSPVACASGDSITVPSTRLLVSLG